MQTPQATSTTNLTGRSNRVSSTELRELRVPPAALPPVAAGLKCLGPMQLGTSASIGGYSNSPGGQC